MAEGLSREVSPETKAKQSIKKQGSLNPNYQRERSSETKKKISNALRQLWRNIPPKMDDSNNSKGF